MKNFFDQANHARFSGSGIGAIISFLLFSLFWVNGFLAYIILGIGLHILLTVLMYVIADATKEREFGQQCLGIMIGLNAGANAAILLVLSHWSIAVVIGFVNILASHPGMSKRKTFHFTLSILSFAMPMSWLAIGMGLIFYLVNLILAGLTLNRLPIAKIYSLDYQFSTNSFCQSGGIICPQFGYTGFNLGNFNFLREGSSQSLIDHESGHCLNVAALGSIFHFIGAIDETVYPMRYQDAYAEHLAQSHDIALEEHLDIWKAFVPRHS